MIIKNSNVRRMLFDNRYKILVIIMAIILILSGIRFMNNMAKSDLEAKKQESQNTITKQEVYKPEQTVISGSNVTQTQQEDNSGIINEFITYCNNKEIEKAYSLLSEECKEEVFYNNLQNFKQNYVDKIFTTKKTASIQSWVNSQYYTYQVNIMDDMLATGQINSTQVEDYYSVVKKNNELKLNINGYVGVEEINQVAVVDGIKITVLKKHMFKEYETYEIDVANTTQNTILVDTRKKTDSVYLKNQNDSEYYAFMYEVIDTKLVINPNQEKTLDIRFNKIYSNRTLITQMVFDDIVTDYDSYQINKEQYTKRLKIAIDI